ncbi:MAG: DUF4340 domain-containing protein [Clostridia bacterium]|nr:DUF4340 domain-containing protein [Clostridia bacterium]
MKKKKGLLVLVIMLAVFVGLYFVIDSGILEKSDTTDTSADDVPVIDLTINKWSMPAVAIRLTNDTGSYYYDHSTSSTWKCMENPNYPLDATKMDEMAAILGQMTATRRLVKNNDNLELFGLNDPIAQVTFSSATGLSGTLKIGMQNQATTDYYVLYEGVDAIFMLSAGYVDYFLKDLMSYIIVPEFPDIVLTDITSVSYTSAEKTFTTGKLASTNSSHSDLISGINSMYVSAVENPYTEDLAAYGLDNPSIEATFNYERFEGGLSTGAKTFTLKVGNQDPENDRYYYATISSYPNTVYRLFYMSLEHLTEAAEAFPKK